MIPVSHHIETKAIIANAERNYNYSEVAILKVKKGPSYAITN